MKVEEIVGKIENLVKEGTVIRDEIIILPDMPKDLMVSFSGCYAGNKRFEFSKDTKINSKSGEETYDLFIRYLGEENA